MRRHRRLSRSFPALLAAVVLTTSVSAGTAVSAAPPLPAEGGACSGTVQAVRYSDSLDGVADYEGEVVGNVSALAVDRGGRIAALSDRSALFTLAVDRSTADAQVLGVVPLSDEAGTDLDSEGLVAMPDGSWLVSTERDPAVRLHSRDGEILDRLDVPALLSPGSERLTPNGAFESLTASPRGAHRVVAGMEYPLTGDEDVVRWQTWDRLGRSFSEGEQWAYPVVPERGVVEMAAIGEDRFLVLERGWTPETGSSVQLFLADARGAADVSDEEYASTGTVREVRKTLLADLADCPSMGATSPQTQANPLLDNYEAMVITGTRGGQLSVLLASDNNDSRTQVTRFLELRVQGP